LPFFEHLLSKAAEGTASFDGIVVRRPWLHRPFVDAVAIEAGPSAILQVWALLVAPNPSAGQLVIIVLSAVCACWVRRNDRCILSDWGTLYDDRCTSARSVLLHGGSVCHSYFV
jgi:hypothetical protein